MSHEKAAQHVLDQVDRHTAWFNRSIPMIASENLAPRGDVIVRARAL